MKKLLFLLLMTASLIAKGQSVELEKSGFELSSSYQFSEHLLSYNFGVSYVHALKQNFFMRYGVDGIIKDDEIGFEYTKDIMIDDTFSVMLLPNRVYQISANVSGNYRFYEDGKWTGYGGVLLSGGELEDMTFFILNVPSVRIRYLNVGLTGGVNYNFTERLYINGEVNYLPLRLFHEIAVLRFEAMNARGFTSSGSDFLLFDTENIGIRLRVGYYLF